MNNGDDEMLELLALIFCFYYALMLYRNRWVFKQRQKLRDSIPDDEFCQKYYLYWDFNKMLNHFWIWDIEKMKWK